MKASSVLSIFVCLLASFALAWEKEDHEIFRLRDDVIAREGPDTTFYSFVGVSPKASQDDINKAYRKKASQMHPDKAKARFVANYGKPKKTDGGKASAGVHKKPSAREVNAFHKDASERFARLGVVANILRGPQRERYDYFLKNGFPAWRGTGYYYTRFRPGIGSVLIGLFIAMGGVAHYAAMYLGWKRQKDFVERYIRHARKMAWGNETGIPGISNTNINATSLNTGFETQAQAAANDEQGQAQNWNRRDRRAAEKENRRAGKNGKVAKVAKENGISAPQNPEPIATPQGAKKRVIAENGKVLIVDSIGHVYLEEETEEGEVHEYLLDPNEIPAPTIYDTALFTLPKWIYRKGVGRFMSAPIESTLEAEAEANGQTTEDAAISQATAVNQNAEVRKRKPR